MPDSREAIGRYYSLCLLPRRETWEWFSNPHALSSSTSSQSPGVVVKYFSSLIPSLFASLLALFFTIQFDNSAGNPFLHYQSPLCLAFTCRTELSVSEICLPH